MNERANTLLAARREHFRTTLGRDLQPPMTGPSGPLSAEIRTFLREEAEDLYWNELEWEHITDEESLEGGPLTELAFPGLLAFVRGLLLTEVMPDALAPASPRPQVVEDVLGFLCARVVELQDSVAGDDAEEADRVARELNMTSGLVDLVLYLYHQLDGNDIEKLEGAKSATA